MRRRAALILVAMLVLAGLALLLSRRTNPTPPHATGPTLEPAKNSQSANAASITSTPLAPPFAERILDHYADPARPPEEDLQAIARTLDNFALLVKGDNPLPLGANEDIAAALRGKNQAALRALSDDHRAFNAQGQLVDRWGTPLYFHAESRDRLDVRSAGPDRRMWTADDLHRKHGGRFLRGEALLAPSLYDAGPARP